MWHRVGFFFDERRDRHQLAMYRLDYECDMAL